MPTLERPLSSRPYEHLVLDFLAYLEFERGLSRNTLEAYRGDLLQFGRHIEERHLDALKLGAPDVADFQAALAAAGASPATLHRKAACLRSFYRHLLREEVRSDDPTSALSSPRRGKRLPQVLTRGEVATLLDQPRGTEPTALRDRGLLAMR